MLLSIASFVIVYALRSGFLKDYSPFPSPYHGDFWQTATVSAMIFSVGMFCQTLRFYDRGLLFMGRAALFMALLIMTLKAHDFMNLVARPVRPDMFQHEIMARGRPVSESNETYLRDISFGGINIQYELTAADYSHQQINKDSDNGRYRLMLPATGRPSRRIPSLPGPNQGQAGSPDHVPEPASE